jgi:hypothetical protein
MPLQRGQSHLPRLAHTDAVIEATDSDNDLVINTGETAVNDGTLEATGAGGLVIQSAVNHVGGLIEASGTGSIRLPAGRGHQGRHVDDSQRRGHRYLPVQGSNVLDGTGSAVDNAGSVVVEQSYPVVLRATMDNTGMITSNSNGSITGLQIDSSGLMIRGTAPSP